jgi:hypothetical protein
MRNASLIPGLDREGILADFVPGDAISRNPAGWN